MSWKKNFLHVIMIFKNETGSCSRITVICRVNLIAENWMRLQSLGRWTF